MCLTPELKSRGNEFLILLWAKARQKFQVCLNPKLKSRGKEFLILLGLIPTKISSVRYPELMFRGNGFLCLSAAYLPTYLMTHSILQRSFLSSAHLEYLDDES